MSGSSADREHPHYGQAQRDFGGAGRNGLGLGRGHSRGLADEVFTHRADRAGAAEWARRQDWQAVDPIDPRAAVAAALVHSAPVRSIDADHHPRTIRAGRIDGIKGVDGIQGVDGIDALAFDIAVSAAAGWTIEWAVTALALPAAAPTIRWTPARLWLHNPQDLTQLPSGDAAFDARWHVLGAPGDGRAAQLAGDRTIQQALLATDDGDDIYTAAGHLAALRPDGHRPELKAHHVRLLAILHRRISGT